MTELIAVFLGIYFLIGLMWAGLKWMWLPEDVFEESDTFALYLCLSLLMLYACIVWPHDLLLGDARE